MNSLHSMVTGLLFCLVSLATSSVDAQRRPAPRSGTQGDQVKTNDLHAKMPDGREVILHRNGTWEFSGEQTGLVKVIPSKTVVLNLEVGVVMQSGDAKPVARTEFYLMDGDPSEILAARGITRIDEYRNTKPVTANDVGLAILYSSLEDEQKLLGNAMPVLKQHTIKLLETDFSGKASVNDVPIGKYYLFGATSVGKSKIIWNFPVDITLDIKVTLDQNNAVQVF